MLEINEDQRITDARKLLEACEEAPGGHMVQFFIEKIVVLIRDSGGTFSDIGTTAERLRQLYGEDFKGGLNIEL